MLSQAARLGREEVSLVVKNGRRVLGGGLSARFLPGEASLVASFAIVISAKQVPSAVARHQLKRRLRAAIREWQSAASPLRSMQVVIFVDRLAANWDYQTIKATLAKLFYDLQRV